MLQFYTTKEVAAALNTTDRKVRHDIKTGKIDAFLINRTLEMHPLNTNNYMYIISQKELTKLLKEKRGI